LETHTAIKNLDTEKYQIVFECIDGYKPMMPLQKFFSVKSFLAVTDAPKVNYGQKIIKDGNEMLLLLVLPGVSAKETDLECTPDKIHLVPNDENIAFLF
jgi:HSP20 family molecular chaperone IbpA